MTAFADPRKVRYAPEVLPEAFNTATVSTSGSEVAAYSRYEPFVISITNLMVERGTSLETSLHADGLMAMRVHNEGVADWADLREFSKVNAKRDLTIQQKATGGVAETNIGMHYNVEVRDPSIIDKIRLGLQLTDEEAAIAAPERLDLKNQDNSGLIPRHPNLLGDEVFNQFDEVLTVARRMPVIAAGGEEDIGSTIYVPTGKVCVLLGIAIDSATIAGAVGAGDTFVYVDRDAERNYIRLDAAVMPGIAGTVADYMLRMYIPALEKFRVFVDSTTGLAAGTRARFLYGVRKMTILDHLKWNIPFKPSELKDANDSIAKYGLTERVAAGVL